MKINMAECEVDWVRTKENINSKLNRLVYKNALSEQFFLGDRTLQRKLNPRDKAKPSIGELVMISRFLQCELEDLIVLQGDPYINQPHMDFDKATNPEMKTPEAVKEYIALVERGNSKREIRNLNEFLLYLPLIDEDIVRNTVFRCYGNLAFEHRNYVRSQMNYLYKSIQESPEKRFADWYKDNVLRVKGDSDIEVPDNLDSEGYLYKVMEYARVLDAEAKYRLAMKKVKHGE